MVSIQSAFIYNDEDETISVNEKRANILREYTQ